MKGATSGCLTVPVAKVQLKLQDNTLNKYIDVLCFYSPFFTSTLLSERDLQSITFGKEYSRQVITKYFELNDKKENKNIQ